VIPCGLLGFVECNQPQNRPLLLKCARGSGTSLRGINWVDSISSSAFRFYTVKLITYFIIKNSVTSFVTESAWWRSWLKYCPTSLKVAVSIPDGVFEIFHLHNPSCRTVVLGSTQPLTEMSTRNISLGVKTAGAKGSTYPDCFEICEPQPSGTLRACPDLCRDCFTFITEKSFLYSQQL